MGGTRLGSMRRGRSSDGMRGRAGAPCDRNGCEMLGLGKGRWAKWDLDSGLDRWAPENASLLLQSLAQLKKTITWTITQRMT